MNADEIHDDASYKAWHVEQAQNAVTAADAFVEKCSAHLAGAYESVTQAEAELARVKAADFTWEESHEHVIAGVQ